MNSTLKTIAVSVLLASTQLAGVVYAQTSMTAMENAAQLKADKAALQRQLKRLDADEARLKAEMSSGKMSAESTDALEVYRAQEAVKGEKAAIAADKDGSLQMKMDRAALHRQIRRLDVAEARLSGDKKEGKMAAESKDSMQVSRDQQAIKGEKKDIVADHTKMNAEYKK